LILLHYLPDLRVKNTERGYVTRVRYNPCGATLAPAFLLSLLFMISLNCFTVILPLPTSNSVPVRARTIPRRNLLDVIRNITMLPFIVHCADLTSQIK